MELNVGIKKAIITSLSCSLRSKGEEKNVEFDIHGDYLTAQNKKVSTFYFNSAGWMSEEVKLEIPQEIKDQMQAIFDALTPLIYHKITHMYKELPEIVEVVQPATEEVKTKDVDPDEIPF